MSKAEGVREGEWKGEQFRRHSPKSAPNSSSLRLWSDDDNDRLRQSSQGIVPGRFPDTSIRSRTGEGVARREASLSLPLLYFASWLTCIFSLASLPLGNSLLHGSALVRDWSRRRRDGQVGRNEGREGGREERREGEKEGERDEVLGFFLLLLSSRQALPSSQPFLLLSRP
jgi:hypothetical protein